MPRLDFKGREITKKAPTWDKNAEMHVCCYSKKPQSHFKKCGELDFDKEKEEIETIEQRIPMLASGRAKVRKCLKNHVFFTSSEEASCPFCTSKRKLGVYVDPRLPLKEKKH